MELSFVKCSPTENMTILVETPVAEELQRKVGDQLIAYECLCAEQAGFIQKPTNPLADASLRMMGGEFCGNATLSLAAWMLEQRNLPVGSVEELQIEVVGTKNLVKCKLKKLEKGFSGVVDMPLPLSIEEQTFWLDGVGYTLPVVTFEGISHVIVEEYIWGKKWKEMALYASKAWADEMPDAYGILVWNETKQILNPLVCLKGSTLVWEGGCGSGTSALGAYIAMRERKSISVDCNQPGGVMGASVKFIDGRIQKIQMRGNVFIVAEGTVYL